jgi:hypothetical protein
MGPAALGEQSLRELEQPVEAQHDGLPQCSRRNNPNASPAPVPIIAARDGDSSSGLFVRILMFRRVSNCRAGGKWFADFMSTGCMQHLSADAILMIFFFSINFIC